MTHSNVVLNSSSTPFALDLNLWQTAAAFAHIHGRGPKTSLRSLHVSNGGHVQHPQAIQKIVSADQKNRSGNGQTAGERSPPCPQSGHLRSRRRLILICLFMPTTWDVRSHHPFVERCKRHGRFGPCLRRRGHRPTTPNRRRRFARCLRGKNIIHRDLKPENILLCPAPKGLNRRAGQPAVLYWGSYGNVLRWRVRNVLKRGDMTSIFFGMVFGNLIFGRFSPFTSKSWSPATSPAPIPP